MLYIIILVIIVAILLWRSTQVEHMSVGEEHPVIPKVEAEVVTGGRIPPNRKPFEGTFTNFNGRMAIDDQYFYDKLFDDVVYYENDYDPDTFDLLNTGWNKCNMNCQGNCVEYFLSGASYCFPY